MKLLSAVVICCLLLSCKSREFNPNEAETEAAGAAALAEPIVVRGTAFGCAELGAKPVNGALVQATKPMLIKYFLSNTKDDASGDWSINTAILDQGKFGDANQNWKGVVEHPLVRNPQACTSDNCVSAYKLATDSSKATDNFKVSIEVQQKIRYGSERIVAMSLGGVPNTNIKHVSCPDTVLSRNGSDDAGVQKGSGGTGSVASYKSFNAKVGARLASEARKLNTGGSGGQCYAYVARAMINANFISNAEFGSLGIDGSYSDNAYQFHRWARDKPGASSKKVVIADDLSPQKAPAGAILVYEPRNVQMKNLGSYCGTSHQTAGHIEISLGNGQACSDFCRPIPNCALKTQVHVLLPITK